MSQELLFLLFLFFVRDAYYCSLSILPGTANHLADGRTTLARRDRIRSHQPYLKVLESYDRGAAWAGGRVLFWLYNEEEKIKGRIQKFYEGAAGSAAKALGGEEAGLGPTYLKELSNVTLVCSGNRD